MTIIGREKLRIHMRGSEDNSCVIVETNLRTSTRTEGTRFYAKSFTVDQLTDKDSRFLKVILIELLQGSTGVSCVCVDTYAITIMKTRAISDLEMIELIGKILQSDEIEFTDVTAS